MKTKVERFVNQVEKVRNSTTTTVIKIEVGNSTDNNRVPSVMQLAGFLFNDNQTSLFLDILFVRSYLLKSGLLKRVRRNNNRTDAYDVNEFVTAIRRYILSSPNRRKEVNGLINNY